MTMQRPHHPDPGEHRRAAAFGDQHERLADASSNRFAMPVFSRISQHKVRAQNREAENPDILKWGGPAYPRRTVGLRGTTKYYSLKASTLMLAPSRVLNQALIPMVFSQSWLRLRNGFQAIP
jgi:hypothetical protein